MGRVLSSATAAGGGSVIAANGLPLLPGQLPLFGSGHALIFYPGNGVVDFVPRTIRHRIRVLGGGASGLLDGQSSSFANLISATGGKKSNGLVGGVGGLGVGGDFQASGGAGGAGVDEGDYKRAGGGGGGAGSQLGVGGAGGAGRAKGGEGAGGGGGAVGGRKGADGSSAGGGFGSSVFSFGTSDAPGSGLLGGGNIVTGAPLELPYFFFIGAGASGSTPAGSGGGGCGGNRTIVSNTTLGGTAGVMGGGSGGGGCSVGGSGDSSACLFGGGQGGSLSWGGLGGGGGGGFAMGEFDLAVDQPYAVTVAQRIQSQPGCVTSGGLVIVEW